VNCLILLDGVAVVLRLESSVEYLYGGLLGELMVGAVVIEDPLQTVMKKPLVLSCSLLVGEGEEM
jgi:hypothetical protein